MARLFDGTDDFIDCDLGAADVTFGTMVAIVRRNANGASHHILNKRTSGGQFRLYLKLSTGNNIAYGHNDGEIESSLAVVTADGWSLVSARKATGTATPRMSRYIYATNVWTHGNGSGTLGDMAAAGASGKWRLSGTPVGAYLDGDLLIAGVWGRLLTDGEVENLAFSLQHWYASVPSTLWLLDQSLTTQNVADLTGGGANQTAITGTALATTHPPVFSHGHRMTVIRSQVVAAVTTPRKMDYYRRLRTA